MYTNTLPLASCSVILQCSLIIVVHWRTTIMRERCSVTEQFARGDVLAYIYVNRLQLANHGQLFSRKYEENLDFVL